MSEDSDNSILSIDEFSFGIHMESAQLSPVYGVRRAQSKKFSSSGENRIHRKQGKGGKGKRHKQQPRCPTCMNAFDAESSNPLVIPACGHTICEICIY